MQTIPYLNFPGTCREAFTFYQKCLGGEIVVMFTHGQTPAAEHVPPEMHDSIMHARLVADGAQLMGSDAPLTDEKLGGVYVSLHVDTPVEAERIYPLLSKDGKIEVALNETFWAERFAMFTDRFGTSWMINCEK
ncbi:MAG: VOC family protein [bacterium]|nr:VOC family protein [Candidatus Kapabacteria bacterium]